MLLPFVRTDTFFLDLLHNSVLKKLINIKSSRYDLHVVHKAYISPNTIHLINSQ